MKLISQILIFLTITTYCETNLSGEIGSITFSPDGNPYIVGENITISENASVTARAGCVFLFKPFTGILVEGSLTVEGKPEKPVIFTSINDGLYSGNQSTAPNPFDWNGILISKNASAVSFFNFLLTYSVYGIKSQKEFIILSNGTFTNNGQFHFTINDNPKKVIDGIPYTYRSLSITYDPNNAQEGSVPVDQNRYEPGAQVVLLGNTNGLRKKGYSFQGWNTNALLKGKNYAPGSTLTLSTENVTLYAKWGVNQAERAFFTRENVHKKIIPLAFGTAGIVFGALSIDAINDWNKANNAYVNETSTIKQKNLKDTGKKSTIKGSVFGALSLTCLPCGLLVYLRNNGKNYSEQKLVSFSPAFGAEKIGLSILLRK